MSQRPILRCTAWVDVQIDRERRWSPTSVSHAPLTLHLLDDFQMERFANYQVFPIEASTEEVRTGTADSTPLDAIISSRFDLEEVKFSG